MQAPHKNTPNRSYYIVGAGLGPARPRRTRNPENPPPHRWRACNAGPYKQKGSPTQKHPQPFLLYSRGGAWLRPGVPNAGSCVSPRSLHRTPPPTPNTPTHTEHPPPTPNTPAPTAAANPQPPTPDSSFLIPTPNAPKNKKLPPKTKKSQKNLKNSQNFPKNTSKMAQLIAKS